MSGPPTIETGQLRLRAPRLPGDVDPLFAIQGDADAMRFTWCAPCRERSVWHVESHAARFATDGVAPWTAEERCSGAVVGWGGLSRDGDGAELSYFFAPSRWGRGFASELVAASVAHGFGTLRLASIHAWVHSENAASIRVLEKNGFVLDPDGRRGGEQRYVIARSAWRAARRAAAARPQSR